MRRGKRIKTGELPKDDPVIRKIVVTPGIPVEMPQLQPVEINAPPKKQQIRRPQ